MAEQLKTFEGKFNRKFNLKVEISKKEFIEIETPLTLDFSIVRNNLASANTAHFTIYNLAPETRSQIYKDQYDISTFRAIQLVAGYDGMMCQVFNGAVKVASSHRQGSDFLTEIEGYDGMMQAGANISQTAPAGTSRQEIIKNLAASIPGLQGLVVGDKFTDESKRGVAMMGNPQDMLQQLSNNSFYVDSQKGYALDQTEVVQGDIRLISYENGLLNTPRFQETLVEVEMLFEPRLKPSQLIELKSTTEPRFNGLYKVTGITHSGTISGAIAGDCKTKLIMTQIKNYKVIQDVNTQEFNVVKK